MNLIEGKKNARSQIEKSAGIKRKRKKKEERKRRKEEERRKKRDILWSFHDLTL